MSRLSVLAVLVGLTLLLQGCALVPGYDAYTLRMTKESSVKLPVWTPQGLVAQTIKVQEIDAELIIDKERALYRQPPKKYRPPAHSDYRLGPGDIINVVVWGHPDLTIPSGEFRTAEESGTVVAEDGTIFYPYAGVVKVAGRTPAEVRAMLTEALRRVIEDAQLEVRMTSFRSKRVYVVGQVKSPGVYSITDIPMTVVEAINEAGGLSGNADRANIILTRNGETRRINMLAVYEEGDVGQNIQLRHGDILNVPDNEVNKVFMMGEVRRAGTLPIDKGRLTLAEALSESGNINMATANPYQIFVVRGGPLPEIYHLSAKEPDALLLADRFPLEPRDIVYVDTADLVRWNKFVSNLLPTRNFFNLDTAIQDGGSGQGF